MDKKRLGIAAGIIWGAAMFVMTWFDMWSGYATEWLKLMADIYPGYTVSPGGSIVGFIYGFIDLFLFFFLVIWLYDKLGEKKKKKARKR